MIAIIRSSDDVAEARTRLIEAFDLTEIQANYILDMQLRRLTRFSAIELQKERDELLTRIADLQAIIDDPARLRAVVSGELDEVARTHGTPRRTVLLASGGAAVATARGASQGSTPLEIADDPCWVLLSSAGLLARTDSADPLPSGGGRAAHDVIVGSCRSTARGGFGLLTSLGRLVRGQTIDLPSVPSTAQAPNLQGGSPVGELFPLQPGERVAGVSSLGDTTHGWVLGTERGVVKRVNPEVLARDAWDIVRLDDGDRVVGAVELAHDRDELVFVTSDAQLLHFPAASVRPQGRTGGGMAGVKLADGARVVFFGVSRLTDSVLVSVAGTSTALPGTDPGSVKVTPFNEYPGKGRGTGGVRCQRFLKGEDVLQLAWVGPTPAVAAAASGSPVELPPIDPRRDASGTPAPQPIAAVSTRHHDD